MRLYVRYIAYPFIVGGAAVALLLLANAGASYWPFFPAIVISGIALVGVLERPFPHKMEWNRDHDGDTLTDSLHWIVSYLLIQISVVIAFNLQQLTPDTLQMWPSSAPLWLQILLAGLILDLGLYVMHRASHRIESLWRLHAIHHSPRRLYWLNGGRRHPLSALVLAGPSLVVLLLVGATPIAVAAWLSFMSIHLAFQHANLDYRLGPLRYCLAVAEMHRFHHKREFEDSQVNFGEVFLIWDHIFGSFHDASRDLRSDEVGMREAMPDGYLGQLIWPLRTRK